MTSNFGDLYDHISDIIFNIIIVILLTSINNKKINEIALTMVGYFLFRWITNYRQCTISYLECKLRGVKKEDGYIYNILNWPI